MSTITLTGNMFSRSMGVGGFFDLGQAFSNLKQTASSLTTQLNTLKNKIDVASTVATVDTSTQQVSNSESREETKKSSLSLVYEKLDEFIANVDDVDDKVSTKVEELKDDFYSKYSYLKPESEKGFWERVGDGAKALWDGLCDIGNAIANFVVDVVEWCKENIVALVTALVVILAAAVLVIWFGPLAVAAIAGLISLLMSVADIGCMLLNDGKGIAQTLRKSEHPFWADVFNGIQWGCDVVSILFPAASFAKQGAALIAKEGVGSFLKATKQSFVLSMKDMFNKLFKSKDGLKNAFKIFIFDVDDLKLNTKLTIMDSAQWVSDGTKLVPAPNNTEGFKMLKKYNIDGLPMDKFGNWDSRALSQEILDDLLPNGSSFDIANFSSYRGKKDSMKGMSNFAQANRMLAEANNGITIGELENMLGFKLVWHEESNLKTMTLLPAQINHGAGHYAHTGGVSIYKFMFPRTSNIIKNDTHIILPEIIKGIMNLGNRQ
ncbi:MAG: hypothetical protein U0L18_08390 [Acutalibacteraceae bacterium]|nr:hypothetical protein [Acutalibacteraceae bacterium]